MAKYPEGLVNLAVVATLSERLKRSIEREIRIMMCTL
jgi:hypothetical protein